LNDGTLPGCITNYPHAEDPNRCEICEHFDLCKESTRINQKRRQKLKAELLEKIEECLDVIQGVASQ